jgi:Ca2+-transporting ATPase
MTSGVADTPRSGRPPGGGGLARHTLSADQALESEGVDGRRGLSSAEAAARARRSGPNKLAAGKAEPRWHAFLRQYADPMQIGLLAAGIVSIYPLKQLGTGILLIFLTLFNAAMNLQQEGKAAASVAALRRMTVIKARVRRDRMVQGAPAAAAASPDQLGRGRLRPAPLHPELTNYR